MPSSTTSAPVQVFTTAFVAFLAIGSTSISAFSPMVSTMVNMRQSVHTPVISSRKHMYMPLQRPPPIMMSKIDEHNFESSSPEFETQTTKMMMTEKKDTTTTTTTTSTTNKINTKDNNNDSIKMTSMQLMAAAAAFALAFTPLQNADAAMSGGRMGGSVSAPRQTMSRPAPKRSSSSSSYIRGGYSSRPSVTIAPSIGFGGGYGYGGGYAVPYFSPFHSPYVPRVYGGLGVTAISSGPGFLLVLGGFLFAVSLIFLNTRTQKLE